MGSSAKKKKEKKKDFQKTKLRVGKTKAKADNFTDTSFKARSITINQQSLTTVAPSSTTQFAHQFSLVTSKSESQRRAALAHLTTHIASQPVTDPLPVPIPLLLPRLLPVLLDGVASVRKQLLKLLACLPRDAVRDRVETCLLYVRAGMTHLAEEIRLDALEALAWLLDVAGDVVVACVGGWTKMLHTFMSMMGWASTRSSKLAAEGWGSISKLGLATSTKGLVAQITVLARFLRAGLLESVIDDVHPDEKPVYGVWDRMRHLLPTKANAFAHLNLFGSPSNSENEMCGTREERAKVFRATFEACIGAGIANAKQRGGELGRVASTLQQVVHEGMAGFTDANGDI